MEALYTKQLKRLSQSIQSDSTHPLNSVSAASLQTEAQSSQKQNKPPLQEQFCSFIQSLHNFVALSDVPSTSVNFVFCICVLFYYVCFKCVSAFFLTCKPNLPTDMNKATLNLELCGSQTLLKIPCYAFLGLVIAFGGTTRIILTLNFSADPISASFKNGLICIMSL